MSPVMPTARPGELAMVPNRRIRGILTKSRRLQKSGEARELGETTCGPSALLGSGTGELPLALVASESGSGRPQVTSSVLLSVSWSALGEFLVFL